MPVDVTVAADFSGGQASRKAATDFTDRQWAKLDGFVLESQSELRSQWPLQSVGTATGFVSIAPLEGHLVGVKSDGTVWYATLPADGAALATVNGTTWTEVSAITDTDVDLLGAVPRKTSGAGWVQALLFNSTSGAGSAWLLYFDSGPQVEELSSRYPTASTSDAMPKANVVTTWGDFVVLGDIVWLDDESVAFSSGNAAAYPHGLWFSEPGQTARWDPIEVQFVGQKSGGNQILDMFPIDAGLLVLATSGVFLLRGTPTDHEYEELRVGLAPAGVGSAAYWGATGAAAWPDEAGQVWTTDGQDFVRLDEPLGLERSAGGSDTVAAFGDMLVVARDGRLFAFKLFTEDGTWTELVPPDGSPSGLVADGDSLYLLDGDGKVWRFARAGDGRGTKDGEDLTLTVASRTLDLDDGHKAVMWHRFAVSVSGTGKVVRLTAFPGPALDADSPFTQFVSRDINGKARVVIPGHGSSIEASVQAEFTGDVKVDQFAAWFHRGRDER